MEVILGRIASVDTATGQLVLDVGFPQEPLKTEDENQGQITIVFKAQDLPEEIQKGDLVRVWGTYQDGKMATYFDANMIKQENKTADCDPTGVRKRLRKGQRMGGDQCGRGRGYRHNN
jgi:hypothetical protein